MTKPLIIRQHRIYRRDLQNNPNAIFVFGDNARRVGLGGQAREMRGEPNAHGIATLHAPGQPYQPGEIETALRIIDADIRALLDRQPSVIIWPSDGVGTGLARMPREIRTSMDGMIKAHFGIDNELNQGERK